MTVVCHQHYCAIRMDIKISSKLALCMQIYGPTYGITQMASSLSNKQSKIVFYSVQLGTSDNGDETVKWGSLFACQTVKLSNVPLLHQILRFGTFNVAPIFRSLTSCSSEQ